VQQGEKLANLKMQSSVMPNQSIKQNKQDVADY
jgi:hypothetical protein